MNKIFSNKKILIVVISAVAMFVICAMLIPFIRSVKETSDAKIETAVRELFQHPKIDERAVKRFSDVMGGISGSDGQKKKFEAEAIKKIEEITGGADATEFERAVYSITAQQILLESADYESEAIKEAYQKKTTEILDYQAQKLDFDKFLNALMNEPYPTDSQDEKIYDVSLAYYTCPRDVLVSQFMSDYMNKIKTNAFESKNTDEVLSLCNKLSVLDEYDEFNKEDIADINEIINILTEDAQTIVIKEGEGGYYDGMERDTSSGNESDELFDYVVSTITGTDVNTNSYQVSDVKYYGDLSSYFFESGLAYSYEDGDGQKQSNTASKNIKRLVFLKGEVIYEGETLDDNYIKSAYEDGMINYYKDGNCYGISNTTLVCYVGDKTFKLNLV